MMKKAFLFVLLCVLIFGAVSAVSAGEYGEEQFGISDQYGVFVYDIDGNPIYLWFWSEWARQQIMGDLTAPGDHVMERPASAPDGKFSLGFAKPELKAAAAVGGSEGSGSEEKEKVLTCTCSDLNDYTYGPVDSCASSVDAECRSKCESITGVKSIKGTGCG